MTKLQLINTSILALMLFIFSSCNPLNTSRYIYVCGGKESMVVPFNYGTELQFWLNAPVSLSGDTNWTANHSRYGNIVLEKSIKYNSFDIQYYKNELINDGYYKYIKLVGIKTRNSFIPLYYGMDYSSSNLEITVINNVISIQPASRSTDVSKIQIQINDENVPVFIF